MSAALRVRAAEAAEAAGVENAWLNLAQVDLGGSEGLDLGPAEPIADMGHWARKWAGRGRRTQDQCPVETRRLRQPTCIASFARHFAYNG